MVIDCVSSEQTNEIPLLATDLHRIGARQYVLFVIKTYRLSTIYFFFLSRANNFFLIFSILPPPPPKSNAPSLTICPNKTHTNYSIRNMRHS